MQVPVGAANQSCNFHCRQGLWLTPGDEQPAEETVPVQWRYSTGNLAQVTRGQTIPCLIWYDPLHSLHSTMTGKLACITGKTPKTASRILTIPGHKAVPHNGMHSVASPGKSKEGSLSTPITTVHLAFQASCFICTSCGYGRLSLIHPSAWCCMTVHSRDIFLHCTSGQECYFITLNSSQRCRVCIQPSTVIHHSSGMI